jgi:hypothetical protein
MNAAFRRSVADGIDTAVTANYWVAAGVYSAEQCRAFGQARSDDNHIADQMAIVSGSVNPEPGWVDPVVGQTPGGTIYRLQVAIARTNVYTGAHSQSTEMIHAVLPGNGSVGFMLRC